MKGIINIINFVRGVEPREGRSIDLERPVREQIRVMRENGLRGTFLLQYDALISPNFQRLMNDCKDFCEIGLWLEIVQPLVEDIGEEWHGRYPWDWYCDVGFLIGYEPDVRLRLIDKAMERFKEIYGKYPDSVGSWHIDAVSMGHLCEKYGVSAACICRDQVGTDGYTMQGGYYNQAYYPSVNNMFCPAGTKENQIDMPVFRMLGSDPVYEYDRQVFGYGIRRCATLEAAQLGHYPEWCDWFFEEMFKGRGLCFAYTQAGQENSFGWEKMGEGIEYQLPRIAELARTGRAEVMTLCESGRYYKERYAMTPPASVAVDSAWQRPDMRSVWYYSRFYRVNLFVDKGVARIRDMYVFNENYGEHYLNKRCDTHACEFRNLPVMDGAIYSNAEKGIAAGIYMTADGESVTWDSVEYKEISDIAAEVTLSNGKGYVRITLEENEMTLSTDMDGFDLCPVFDKQRAMGEDGSADAQFANHNNRKTSITYVTDARVDGDRIRLTFGGFDYSVYVADGRINEDLSVSAVDGKIRICF